MTSKYTKEEFEIAVKTSANVRAALIKLGIEPKGGNYKNFYRIAKKFNIDVSGFINSTTYGVDKEKRDCISDQLITDTISSNFSFQAMLNTFGLVATGANNRWIRSKIRKLNLDTSHFTGQGHLKGKTHDWGNKMPLEKVLVLDSPYASSSALKARLIKENILPNRCNICSINSWMNNPLTLHLDHINGNNTDNRLENLRLLCPNCHSQTDTYAGKNIGRHEGT